jgi:uncharacterized membrane protein
MYDEIALILFLFCLIGYLLLLIIINKRDKPSQRTTLNLVYKNWVKNRSNDENLLYATQALRNFIMGNATFISGLLVLIGILVGVYNAAILSIIPFFGIEFLSLGFVQMGVNSIIAFFSLFNFILSIRYIVRVSILLSGDAKKYSKGEFKAIDITEKAFILAQNHWMFGNRGLFFLIATLSWLIDTFFFMILTIIIILYLIFFQDKWIVTKS